MSVRICPNCTHTEENQSAAFCGECGHRLMVQVQEQYCSGVPSHPMDPSAKFCPECGRPPLPTVLCENNHPMNATEKFCQECGRPRKGTKAPTTQPTNQAPSTLPMSQAPTTTPANLAQRQSLHEVLSGLRDPNILQKPNVTQLMQQGLVAVNAKIDACVQDKKFSEADSLQRTQTAAEEKKKQIETALREMEEASGKKDFSTAAAKMQIIGTCLTEFIGLLDPEKASSTAPPVAIGDGGFPSVHAAGPAQDEYSKLLTRIQAQTQAFSVARDFEKADKSLQGEQALEQALQSKSNYEKEISVKNNEKRYDECAELQKSVDELKQYMNKFEAWLKDMQSGQSVSHPQQSQAVASTSPGLSRIKTEPTPQPVSTAGYIEPLRRVKSAPSCDLPGCGKPTWDGQPGYCSRYHKSQASVATAVATTSATVPTCIFPGCAKPTYDGQPGGYCGRYHRDQANASAP